MSDKKTMTLGERIRQYRKRAKMTQKQLAEMIGTAEITIRQYEADKYKPKYDKLVKIADALSIPVHLLVVGQTPAGETPGEIRESFNIVLELINEKNDISNEEKKELITSLNKAMDVYIRMAAEKEADSRWKAQNDERRKTIDKLLSQLNDLGLNEAIRQLEMLVQIPKYTDNQKYIELTVDELRDLRSSADLHEKLVDTFQKVPDNLSPEELYKMLSDIFDSHDAQETSDTSDKK